MKIVTERPTDGQRAAPPPSHGDLLKPAATAPLLAHCENCGAQLQGHWCAQCGQPAIDYRRSFRHVVADLLSEFLNWDSKFFKTIALLLVQPWKLTNDFLAGHRVRYVHPLRLYLLGSILFFFAATYGIKSAHFQPINLSPGALAELRAELERGNVAPEIRDKFEQALGGKPIPARERSELEQQLKNPDLPQIARYAIQQRLAHGDPLPDARAKLQEAIKALTPEMRARVESSLTRAQEDVRCFNPIRAKNPTTLPNGSRNGLGRNSAS